MARRRVSEGQRNKCGRYLYAKQTKLNDGASKLNSHAATECVVCTLYARSFRAFTIDGATEKDSLKYCE
jgi:hypothetical protein